MPSLRILISRVAALGCCLLAPTSVARACVAEPWPPERLCETTKVIVRATAVKYVREPEEIVLQNLSYTRAGEIQFKVQEILKGGRFRRR